MPKIESRRDLGICLVLVALVWAVFGQTLGFDFVDYDDRLYLQENQQVMRGLTPEGIAHAFTHRSIGLWDPLVTLSHMLAWGLSGAEPAGHHFINVLLHTGSVILLFVVLQRMTGAPWRSGFVAALFAVHPLRAESVAWIAERKDVLSGLFFMLTLWAYERYARVPSLGRYLAMAGLFVCGLMSKVMLVTLPFVLLLLDYWPLRRLVKTRPGAVDPSRLDRRVILEKIPLLALAAAAAVVAMTAPHMEVIGEDLQETPLLLRLREAPLGCVIYLRQLVMPSGLAVLYPHPEDGLLRWWPAATGLLFLMSIGAYLVRKKHPAMFVGWYWNLIMLAPVCGVVQISRHWMADHYTYLPQIGLGIVLTWTAADWIATWRRRREILGALAAIILVALVVIARQQTAHWRDSETLWTHALSADPFCWAACYNLGSVLQRKGKLVEAQAQYRKALEIKPDYAEVYNNLGVVLQQKGSLEEAVAHYQKAIEISPGYARAHNNLGNALGLEGQFEKALAQYQKALDLSPDYAEAHNNLGRALAQKGQSEAALAHFERALEIKPNDPLVHLNLGNVLAQRGRLDEALLHYQKAIEINPGSAEVHNNLGALLGGRGQLDEALLHYQKAIEINPGYPEAHYALGVLLQQKGRPEEALLQYQMALEIRPDYALAHLNLGNVLQQQGDLDEALPHYQKALEIDPGSAEGHNNLGVLLGAKGKLEEAVAHYRRALEVKPDYAEAHNNLGFTLQKIGRVGEAMLHYQKALNLKPGYAEAQKNLGVLLGQERLLSQEAARYQKAIEIDPDDVQSLNNLAHLLATCEHAPLRDGVRAVELAQRASRLSGGSNPGVLGILAAAQAEAGDFSAAVQTARRAIGLAEGQGNSELVNLLEGHLKMYQSGQPLRDRR